MSTLTWTRSTRTQIKRSLIMIILSSKATGHYLSARRAAVKPVVAQSSCVRCADRFGSAQCSPWLRVANAYEGLSEVCTQIGRSPRTRRPASRRCVSIEVSVPVMHRAEPYRSSQTSIEEKTSRALTDVVPRLCGSTVRAVYMFRWPQTMFPLQPRVPRCNRSALLPYTFKVHQARSHTPTIVADTGVPPLDLTPRPFQAGIDDWTRAVGFWLPVVADEILSTQRHA